MLSKRTRNRLLDIVEDSQRIETFIGGMTLSEFLANELTIFAVERLLQRISEAAVQIDPEDATKLGARLPVAEMRALGNRLRHEYRYVDRTVVFDLARTDVPALTMEIEVVLALDSGHD